MTALTPEQRLTVEAKFRDLANRWTERTAYRSNLASAVIPFFTKSSPWESLRSR